MKQTDINLLSRRFFLKKALAIGGGLVGFYYLNKSINGFVHTKKIKKSKILIPGISVLSVFADGYTEVADDVVSGRFELVDFKQVLVNGYFINMNEISISLFKK